MIFESKFTAVQKQIYQNCHIHKNATCICIVVSACILRLQLLNPGVAILASLIQTNFFIYLFTFEKKNILSLLFTSFHKHLGLDLNVYPSLFKRPNALFRFPAKVQFLVHLDWPRWQFCHLNIDKIILNPIYAI